MREKMGAYKILVGIFVEKHPFIRPRRR